MAPLLNQIQTCLKLQKLWRFVGFASAIVGLLCFALSSSFNSLFGEWNLLKTFLYIIFCFIICIAVLFANVWQHSSSLRLEAHLAFLVLTITSFYTFFLDKVAKGKPDAYSLVSCAAFAVMSLSLSQQTHFGFEVDLLYFFLGALIVQLMKIKWLVGIAGAGFSYFLVNLRSYLDVSPEADTFTELQDQSHVIVEVDSLQLLSNASSASALLVTPQEGNTQDHTNAEVDWHSEQASVDVEAIRQQLSASMEALRDQDKKLISLLHGHTLVELFQPDDNLLVDMLPLGIINNLNENVKLAFSAGLEEECCRQYIHCRRKFLEWFLSTLEFEDLNNKDNGIDEKVDRISSWVKAFEIAVHLLFPNERRLCDRVFHGFPSDVRYRSFAMVCKEIVVSLLNFADSFVVMSWSQKIFTAAVEVLTKLSEVIPALESLFPREFDVLLGKEAIRVRERLGVAIRCAFIRLRDLLRHDNTVANPGGIFSSTCDVMRCMKKVTEARFILEQFFGGDPTDSSREWTCPSLSAAVAEIMDLLESNLEAKSRNFTEPALGYVTMMNNIMYIKQKTEALSVMTNFPSDNGEVNLSRPLDHIFSHQIQKQTAKLLQSLEDYLRSSWNGVLGLLNLDSDEESVGPEVAAESMKERLKLFNIQFSSICYFQFEWFARDDIRERIITSIKNMLLPAYGNFIGRFQNVLGEHANVYIHYGISDIEANLNQMFLGGKSMDQ